MALALTIAVLVAFRLLLPPVPGLLKTYAGRWGKRTTITLCALSLGGAALAIFISRR